MALLLEHFRRYVAKTARQRVKLLGGGVKMFRTTSLAEEWDVEYVVNLHAEINDDDIRIVVLCPVQDVLRSKLKHQPRFMTQYHNELT
jgi:hypothetical protein